MQPANQHIVYFGGEMAVSPATHERINQEEVLLSKAVTYLRLWRVE